MKYALALQLLAAILDAAGLRNAKLTSRAVGIRAFYDCLRTSLPEDARAIVPEKLSDDEILSWRIANSIVANPAGEYEVVARYRAREAGFWHEPVLSNSARFRIVRKDPCPPGTPN